LEKALFACEQTKGLDKPYEIYAACRKQLAKAANPKALRILLDAHASVLRDASKLRKALAELSSFYSSVWDLVDGDLILFKGNIPRYEAAQAKSQAALDDNTKGAAE
jgi:hypothetical protein